MIRLREKLNDEVFAAEGGCSCRRGLPYGSFSILWASPTNWMKAFMVQQGPHYPFVTPKLAPPFHFLIRR